MKSVRSIDGAPQVVDVPAPSGDGIRLKVKSSGICGSDLHMLDLGIFGSDFTIGHEFAGLLEDGTPVAIEPVLYCGDCVPCGRGDYNLCHRAGMDVLGFGNDGGMAEEVLVAPEQLVRLPDEDLVKDACLVEPLAVCARALRLAGLDGKANVVSEAGSPPKVAIVGGGTIGQCALAVARHAGAATTLIARHDSQREAALRLGAEVPEAGVSDAEASDSEATDSATPDAAATDSAAPDAAANLPDSSFDIVVDAAGTPDALQLCARLAAPGAAMSLVSTYWTGLELPGVEICMKEIRLYPSIMYGRYDNTRDADHAAKVLATNPEIPKAIITHRYPLDAAPEAFATARDRASGAIKVVLEP